MKYGLIGEKLGHSFSREIHARIADYTYELLELTPQEVGPFIERADFDAINVTIPYKTTVIPYLDYIHPLAQAIGAVNTVVKREGKLYGYNTDYFGMKYLLDSLGWQPEGKKVLILGTGATSPTAMTLLKDLGATPIRVSRTAKGEAVDYPTAYARHTDAAYILNTTPVGMYPHHEGTPIDISCFPHLLGVADAIYHPLRTKLILSAKERGLAAEGGLAMLAAQALQGAELFLDTPLDPALIRQVVREVEREKEHLILIGMPGCGKSTVGKLLAKELNRPCIDIDALIVEEAGCDIPTLFRERGEPYFRDLEARVLEKTLYGKTGAVICTGGGVPLREENRLAMAATGRIFWLDRSPELLIPTSDRPTASTREAMEKRYAERLPVYSATAHCRIPADESPEAVMNYVKKEFLS